MEPHSKLWYLENFNMLDSLTKEEKEQLSQQVSMKQTPKKSVVYFSGDPSKTIFFLKTGKVKISKYSEDGREIILTILGPGEIFGELALTGEEERGEIAEITEDAIICGLKISDLEKMLAQNSKFNLRITKFVGLRLKKIQSRLESLIFSSAEKRIKSFIHELANEYGRKIGNGEEVTITLNLTHDEIAKLTATNRQKVTTVLGDLEKSGIIQYDRKQIFIRNYPSFLKVL